MTMAETDIKDLSDLEFTIPCEWPNCGEPAVVMGRGCPDERHIAVCAGHHRWIRDVIAAVHPSVPCAVCGMPMCVFEYHFDIVEIK